MKPDVFGARATLGTSHGSYAIYRLDGLAKAGLAPGFERLPFSIKVLLEACLRNLDGELVTEEDVKRLAAWNAAAPGAGRGALHARARDAAGFHRRAGRGGPGGDARRRGRSWAATRAASTRWCRWTW